MMSDNVGASLYTPLTRTTSIHKKRITNLLCKVKYLYEVPDVRKENWGSRWFIIGIFQTDILSKLQCWRKTRWLPQSITQWLGCNIRTSKTILKRLLIKNFFAGLLMNPTWACHSWPSRNYSQPLNSTWKAKERENKLGLSCAKLRSSFG